MTLSQFGPRRNSKSGCVRLTPPAAAGVDEIAPSHARDFYEELPLPSLDPHHSPLYSSIPRPAHSIPDAFLQKLERFADLDVVVGAASAQNGVSVRLILVQVATLQP